MRDGYFKWMKDDFIHLSTTIIGVIGLLCAIAFTVFIFFFEKNFELAAALSTLFIWAFGIAMVYQPYHTYRGLR